MSMSNPTKPIPSRLSGVWKTLPKEKRALFHILAEEVALYNHKVDQADQKLRKAKRRGAKAAELNSLKSSKEAWIRELRVAKRKLNAFYASVTPRPPETYRAKPYYIDRVKFT